MERLKIPDSLMDFFKKYRYVAIVLLAGILLMYRCCSVLMEAVGAKVIGGCIEDISSAFTTLAVVYTLLGILFIVFISIVIAIL